MEFAMRNAVRIAVVADYNPNNKYHIATNDSLAHAGAYLGLNVEPVWYDTDKLDSDSAEDWLRECHAVFCGTSSPYRSMEGALRSIRFARERGWPFIGT